MKNLLRAVAALRFRLWSLLFPSLVGALGWVVCFLLLGLAGHSSNPEFAGDFYLSFLFSACLGLAAGSAVDARRATSSLGAFAWSFMALIAGGILVRLVFGIDFLASGQPPERLVLAGTVSLTAAALASQYHMPEEARRSSVFLTFLGLLWLNWFLLLSVISLVGWLEGIISGVNVPRLIMAHVASLLLIVLGRARENYLRLHA